MIGLIEEQGLEQMVDAHTQIESSYEKPQREIQAHNENNFN